MNTIRTLLGIFSILSMTAFAGEPAAPAIIPQPQNAPLYNLEVPAPKPGAHYLLRAMVAGSGGTNSQGIVFWNVKAPTQND